MSEIRRLKLERLYGETPGGGTTDPSSHVSTAVINSYERDVRALLDFCEVQYVNPEINNAMKRLRRVVGYSS